MNKKRPWPVTYKPIAVWLTLLLLCFDFSVSAQATIHTPSITEASLASPANCNWLNTANIERIVGTPPVRVGIFGACWDVGSGTIHFRLATSAGTVSTVQNIAAPAGYVSASNPDIALGNDAFNATYVVVSFTATDAFGGTDIFLNIYQITNYSPAILVNLGNQFMLTATNDVGNSHIDAINREVAGVIQIRDFVVAWETMSCSVSGFMGADAIQWNFANAYNNINTIIASGCINAGVDGAMVDIAGIERFNNPNYDEIALFCYVDPTSGDLYYNEWNINTGLLLGDTYQDGNGVGNIEFPRIDATDPYTQNSNSADALYAIAYRYYDGGGTGFWMAKQANNLNTPNPADIPSDKWAQTAAGDNYSPVVTAFVKDFFDLVYATPPISYADGGNNYVNVNAVVSEGIDALASTGNAGNIASSNATPDIYIVNKNTGGTYPVAVSNSWDYIGGSSQSVREFVCWFNPGGGGSIDCKRVSGGFVYKPADVGENAIMHMSENDVWSASPNPTADRLTVEGEIKGEASYRITDLLGKTLQAGKLAESDRQINVAMLPSGIYLLRISTGENCRDIKFVKR